MFGIQLLWNPPISSFGVKEPLTAIHSKF